MRKPYLALLILLLAAPAFAGGGATMMVIGGGGTAGGGGGGYLVEEDCEGTGTPAGWTDTNSPDWDYTPAIRGSKSLNTNGATSEYTVVDFAAQDTVHIFFRIKPIAIDPATLRAVIYLQDAELGTLARLDIREGNYRIYNGTVNTTPSYAGWTTDGVVYVWMQYTKGTGANGITHIWLSADGTKPGTPTASRTTGDATTQAVKLRLAASTSGNSNVVWDQIYVSATEIGNVDP